MVLSLFKVAIQTSFVVVAYMVLSDFYPLLKNVIISGSPEDLDNIKFYLGLSLVFYRIIIVYFIICLLIDVYKAMQSK